MPRWRARIAAVLALACSAILAPLPSASPQPPSFDVQAHAGGRGETTGESLRAFAKSLELGVNTLEFDINITKDEQPLVWHDPTIEPDQCSDTGPAFAGDPQYPYVGRLVRDLTMTQILQAKWLPCCRAPLLPRETHCSACHSPVCGSASG